MKNDLKDLGIFTYPVLQINGMVYKVKHIIKLNLRETFIIIAKQPL